MYSDNRITIADVTSLVNIILGKGGKYNLQTADVYSDNRITIADVATLINIILDK